MVVEQVKEALTNAKENGHSFEGWSDEDVANDMQAYWEEAETVPIDALVALVKEARRSD